MTIQNEAPEAKDLKRIADALEKLVELQTSSKQPEPTQRKRGTSIERDAEGNVQGYWPGGFNPSGFNPGGYVGYPKTQTKDFTTKLSERGAVMRYQEFIEKMMEWLHVEIREVLDNDHEPFPHKLPTPDVGLMVIDGPNAELVAQWIANTRYDVRIWNCDPSFIYDRPEIAREKAIENGTLDIYLSHEDEDVVEGCRTGGFFRDVPDMTVFTHDTVECVRFVGHDPKNFIFDPEYLDNDDN